MVPSQNQSPPADKPFKKQLDEAACQQTEDNCDPSTIEKATEKAAEKKYIPAAAGPLRSVTGHPRDQDQMQEQRQESSDPSPMIERTRHDGQIEDFVREQHWQNGSKLLK